MIYIIIGIFISLLFLLFCCLDNITDALLCKTRGKLDAVNCKIGSFKDVLKKYNITTPSNIIEKAYGEIYNNLTEIEKKAVNAASNGILKETINKSKLEEKIDKIYNLRNKDFDCFKFIFGIFGITMLTISLCSFFYYTVEIKEFNDKIEVYSNTTNTVRPYEEDVLELLYEIKHGKELAKNNYWTSFRSKKWLELDETPLNSIKDTKGFNTVPPRVIEKR